MAVTATLWTGCVDQATEPDTSLTALLAMGAVFPLEASNQAQYVDAWRVVVSRPGEGVIAEQSGSIGPEQETVSVDVSVTLEAFCETLSIRIELSSGGQVWFQSEGSREVCAGTGNEVQPLELQWVRPQPSITPGSLIFNILEREAADGTIRISYDGNDRLDWMALVEEGDVYWLNFSPRAGSVTRGQPQDVTVTVSALDVAPGRRVRHLVVVGDGFPAPIGRIPVDFTVTQGPRIGLSTTPLSFQIDEGSDPPQQVLTITNVGGGILDWGATDNAGWLSLSHTSGSLAASQSQNVTVSVHTGSLNPGSYLAAITVADEMATNSPQIIAVELTVLEDPEIGLSVPSLTFSTLEGTSPNAQIFTVLNSGGGVLDWQASDDVPWLGVTPSSGTLGTGLGQWVTASVDSDNLPPGSYAGTITFSDPEASNSPRTLPVSLTVIPLVPPTISNLGWTMLQLNDSTCGNNGSRFELEFDYADPDGDVLIAGDSLAGTPVGLQWQFLPEGLPGSASATAGVDGTGFSGTAKLRLCIAYEIEGNTSVDIGLTLKDAGGRVSNQLLTNIPRPPGANSPPQGSVSGAGGFRGIQRGGAPF